jgi:hypothetical protein
MGNGGVAAWLISISALTMACGVTTTTTYLRLPPPRAAPRPAQSVEILSSGPPKRPHLDVALIEAVEESSGTGATTAEIIGKMREEAGRMGCDALILGSAFSKIDSLTTVLTGDAYDVSGWHGTCVFYTDVPGTAQAIAKSR